MRQVQHQYIPLKSCEIHFRGTNSKGLRLPIISIIVVMLLSTVGAATSQAVNIVVEDKIGQRVQSCKTFRTYWSVEVIMKGKQEVPNYNKIIHRLHGIFAKSRSPLFHVKVRWYNNILCNELQIGLVWESGWMVIEKISPAQRCTVDLRDERARGLARKILGICRLRVDCQTEEVLTAYHQLEYGHWLQSSPYICLMSTQLLIFAFAECPLPFLGPDLAHVVFPVWLLSEIS
jgi:hypothetical protein